MSYFVRILSPSVEPVLPDDIAKALKPLDCQLSGDVALSDWTQLEVSDRSDEVLFVIERHVARSGSLVEEELAEFRDEIAGRLPASGADWLRSYLAEVRTIFAFQLLGAIDSENGWDALAAAKGAIHTVVGGIHQADGEGFSNEEGYHVLWQFSDDVTGDWWMAVREGCHWQQFKMDLGNSDHRSAFKAGQIPQGVERV